MKILQVITSLLTGGAEKVVVDLICGLRARGHEVDLAIFNATNMPLLPILRKKCPKCVVHELGHSYYSPMLILKLRKLMKNYDLIHTHNSSPQLFAAIANVGIGKIMVTTEHSTNNRKREHPKFSCIDKWMYRKYDRIVAISDVAKSKLLDYLGDSINTDKVVTINNGVDVDTFHHAEPAGEEQLGFKKTNRFAAVMVAGFREAKDQDTLVKAFARLPREHYELWLVGTGVREKAVKTLVDELGVTDQVRFLGLRQDVPQILSAADAIIMSSHWEGLSLSNIEGMSVGKPFIASDVNGLREVTSGYGLLFPHGDDATLAYILQTLAKDRDYYNEVAKKCLQRAKEYDLTTMVEKYEELYRVIS